MKVAVRARSSPGRAIPRHGDVSFPAAVVRTLAAPGEPLAAAIRGEMEHRLGHDFGHVRIHADAHAAAAARALDSVAFTSGADVVFAEGRYRPQTGDGRRLLAHELVHSLQQGGAAGAERVQAAGAVVAATDPLEAEAAAVAARVAAGERIPPGAVSVGAPAARGRVARQARGALERLPAEVPESPEGVQAVAAEIARLLIFDPTDAFGRAKRRLAQLAPATRGAVAAELGGRVPEAANTRVREILAELLPMGTAAPVTEPMEYHEPEERLRPAAVPAEPEVSALVGPEVPAAEPAEVSDPGEVREPEAGREGPVTAPELAADEAQSVAEGEPVRAAAPEEARPAAPEGATPTVSAGEAEPEESTADAAPVDDTEAEALEAHDQADAEPADLEDEAAARDAETAVAEPGAAEEEAPEPAEADLGADEKEAPEGAEAEPSSDDGDAETPVADLEQPSAAVPEPEPDGDRESVVEKPADVLDDGQDPAGDIQGQAPAPADRFGGDEPPTAETAGAGAQLDAGEDAEPEEPADAALAEVDQAADEQTPQVATPEGQVVAIDDPVEPEAPDLSEAEPAEAMAVVADLPPGQAQAALAGVDAASSRLVNAQRAELYEHPPELDRPTGAPSAAELASEAEPAAAPAQAPVRLARAPKSPALEPRRPGPLPPAPAPVAARAQPPQIQGGPQGELSEDGRAALRASLRALPVQDPGLDLGAGPAPAVPLEGAADPQHTYDERAKLEQAARSAVGDGLRAIMQPAGEQRLVPAVPPERLRAALSPAPPPPPPAAGAGAPRGEDAASIIAREQRGPELHAAAAQGAQDIRARRTEQQATAAGERRRSDESIAQLVRDSAAMQNTRRTGARDQVRDQRTRWSAAEHELVEGALKDGDTTLTTGVGEVARLKSEADRRAATLIADGERDAGRARRDAEQKALAERKRGEEKTIGPLGWLANKATAFFDEIKSAIADLFEKARAAVRAAIASATRLAAEAIDGARDAIVATIQKAGDALIDLGDKMLGGLPSIRDRFRSEIEKRVTQAQNAVNALADELKGAVQQVLDFYGSALDATLSLLEKGLLLIVDAVREGVVGAIKFGGGVVNSFLGFVALVKDIAANPRQWLTNLLESAKDGLRNHLWKAFQIAIKRWFSEKVEEVLGLGLTIWNVLKAGGLSLARIGAMAWEAIKTAIPPTLIQILIEKLISLLVPAAAAVMLIIETLQAAWGTIRRVLEAFERFFAFLKAVRRGKAGPLFANALAAAAVAVIDFAANWLLKRLRKPAGAIAKKLKALAKKLGKKLARLGKGLFKRRRKKPKLKGKSRKKHKRDRAAQAEKRVAAASDFIGKKLVRGVWEPVLWLQMKFARLRWRVRISFKDHGETGTLTISGSPKTTQKAKRKSRPAYAPGIRAYQGFLRSYHHRHHLLTGALSQWWNAAGIVWNDPTFFLDLPVMLHLRGLHRTFAKVDSKTAKTISTAFKRRLPDEWNVEWQTWLAPRLVSWIKGRRPSPRALKAAVDANVALKSRVQREITKSGVSHMLSVFSRRKGVPLRPFLVRGYEMKTHLKYLLALDDLDAAYKKAKTAKKKQEVVDAWQLKLLGGVGRLRKKLKGKDKWIK